MTNASSLRNAAQGLTPDPALRHEPFPLTDIQHAYWLGRGRTLELGNVSCHVYFEWRLPAIDQGRFERAWNRVVQRHDMLRAVVLPTGLQRILPQTPFYEVSVTDLSALNEDDRAAELEALRQRMMHQVFDPARWPLFEVRLTRLAADDIRLHVDFDLLTVDVQSFHIILGELDRFYADPALEAAPIPLSFRDYVLAQEEGRGHARYERDRAWWHERLDELPGAPDLPLARAPHTIEQPDFVRRNATLEADDWRRLNGFAAARNITGSAALLAAFAEVLGQWCRKDGFCINLTHFNRERLHPAVESLVGDFTSVVLVACAPSQPGTSFADRARALQRETWTGLAHRSFSGIEVIRERVRRQGGSGRGSLMPVVLTSLLGLDIDSLIAPTDKPRLLNEPEIVHASTPQVWFDNQAMIRGGRLIYNWITIDALFPEGMVGAMFNAYHGLIERLATDEAAWEAPIPALMPEAQRVVRARVNATARPIAPRLLHAPFLDHAREHPDRPAVIDRQGALSYGELERASASLATVLAETGLPEGGRVVVALPRGRDQAIAVLGILRAGGAYVPVASDAPPERARAIALDSGASLVVTDRTDVVWPEGIRVLSPRELGEGAPAPAERAVDPASLAYVIYTSGSTGTPKGVAIRHEAAWNTIADVNGRLHLGAHDRVLGVSSLAFDLSAWDLFGTLAAGGALVMLDDDRRLDPAHWLACIREHGITVWNSVPSLLDLLLDRQAASAGPDLPLRAVMLSGDWIPIGQPERVREAAPKAAFIAMGGATEASIWSNWLAVGVVPPHWTSIPYGFPLANQSYRVLDDHGRDRPDWVPGHLHIGGSGLAEGYWNDPERTRASFVLAPDTGERLYRTGDRARYWQDGTLEFLGREDTQVKIAGHRIELGEIEAVLERCAPVREAVVTVVERNAARRLVAFVTPRERSGADERSVEVMRAVAAVEASMDRPGLAAARAFQTVADRLACIAVARTLDHLEQTGSQPLPRFEGLVGQWRRLLQDRVTERSDAAFDQAAAELETAATWRGAAHLAGWIITSARNTRAMLTGEIEPVEILFPQGSMEQADSLYRDNPVARHLNALAAAMAAAAFGGVRETPPRVLEVGAGSGSTTASLLDLPELSDATYVFTDISRFFLEAASRRFAGRKAMSFQTLDVNREPSGQGFAPGQFGLIVASNVLHDARDLPRTLGWMRDLLRPGGRLLLVEATLNTPVQMVTAGFLEGFGAFDDFRKEAGLPLLDLAGWRTSLASAGFAPPDAAPASADLGQHVIMARRLGGIDGEAIRREVARFLPPYMVPAAIHPIERLPLSANGKVDRRALPQVDSDAERPDGHGGRELEGPVQHRLAALWSELLGTAVTDGDADFFRSGGDSLLAIRLIGRVRDSFGSELPVRAIFDAPVLADFADLLATEDAATSDRPTLLLFPGSDGTGQVFSALEDATRDSLRIAIVEVASHGALETSGDPLETLVALGLDQARRHAGSGPLLVGGWSSGTVLAAALAARLAAEARPCAGLVLLDPVDWRRSDYFAGRARQAEAGAPDWLRAVVTGQLEAIAAFRPSPLSLPVFCVEASRRDVGWPDHADAWNKVQGQDRLVHRVEADHWTMLSDPSAITSIARELQWFVVRRAALDTPRPL